MAFFTAKGRLRRRSHFLRALGVDILAIIVYATPGWLYASEVPSNVALAATLGLIVLMYLNMVQTVLRLHDLDLRAWWWLVFFVPVVNYVLSVGLLFVQGTMGPNRFGPDPKRPALQFPSPTGQTASQEGA